MTYVTSHWSLDPFMGIVAVIAVWHEIGLRRLCRRSRPDRARKRRRLGWAVYAGLAALLISVQSPIDYYADQYFFIHMMQHLLLMFAAPSLLVFGAPWLPLAHGLPVSWRRKIGRALLIASWSAPLRAVGRTLIRPMVAVVAFNVVMIAWHIPLLFNLGQQNRPVHIWLMHGSFFVAGVAFWLQYIPSHPFRPRFSPARQIGTLMATNVVMVIIAMALSLFSSHSVYSSYAGIPGVTLPPFADQQIGAAILWVCGDFWCYPALVVAFRRLQEQPAGLEGALDRFLRREARLGAAGLQTGGAAKPR